MGCYDKASHSHAAVRCLNCGAITVYPRPLADGRCCGACGGQVMPAGEAVISADCGRKSRDIDLHVHADGLDEIAGKMKQLEIASSMAVNNIKIARKLFGLNVDEA